MHRPAASPSLTVRPKFALALLAILSIASIAPAQNTASSTPQNTAPSTPKNFFERWEQRATATQAKQPAWTVPVISSYPMLVQVFRTEFVHQITPTRTDTWNFDNSKGLNLIPFARTEVDVLVPPYIQHNTKAKDGFGDMTFSLKYRFFTGNAQHGNYILSAFLTASIPTGSYSNGAKEATVTPTLTGGKGFGRFDIFSTLGGNLPVAESATIGRPITFNTVAQYHLGRYLWPEIEDNATFYKGGANDGKTQNFIAPGLMVGPVKLRPSHPESRLGIASGAAMQIATSSFRTYNHGSYYSIRLVF